MSDPIAEVETEAEPKVQAIVQIVGCTDTGLRRSHNQDYIGFDENLGVAVLADGMGGHQAGEVASEMAVEFLMEKLKILAEQQTAGSITGSHLLDSVSNTISDSNAEIYKAAAANPAYKGMGTTVVTTIFTGPHLYIGHAGDSRLYLYREQVLRKITKDHSLVQDLIDRGFYTEREARNASISNVVTRALGIREEVEAEAVRISLDDDDRILVCSDGLTDMVSDWQIAETISDHRNDLDLTAKKLVDLANKHGGKDNISVILMKVNHT
ncbi:MAG: Stp1/IreP family PP2C-type Ser/Thr phosphatase [Gammaproteobacteria bacterium]|jgi:protein phosphatase|nr:Stp1/IreP family PP2C-type Ser/Thr phosphatase [Gammaproteobacteria bacterium]MBT3859173.1 Stp1/IreP family PP2C-type Ser/Thr phosphatase [Gammaproteobacteria bacterium]MBT3987173.1 Stp1/IreP family PP2C-type Ser/Thr phosphatase [Gammaproteobacteria bacterium]MBT4257400.1 Stp1/IreP family PP2C-type Ser/Thr phosphatase [Gammaproteobacteria bacterium]MBT4583126.1 Stp1/IreP family PP2C-type Ser/Thr phosphatase [Gammaproteobacteria bacterium]